MLCCLLLDTLLQRTIVASHRDQLARPRRSHLESGQAGNPALSVSGPESTVHMNDLFLQGPLLTYRHRYLAAPVPETALLASSPSYPDVSFLSWPTLAYLNLFSRSFHPHMPDVYGEPFSLSKHLISKKDRTLLCSLPNPVRKPGRDAVPAPG